MKFIIVFICTLLPIISKAQYIGKLEGSKLRVLKPIEIKSGAESVVIKSNNEYLGNCYLMVSKVMSVNRVVPEETVYTVNEVMLEPYYGNPGRPTLVTGHVKGNYHIFIDSDVFKYIWCEYKYTVHSDPSETIQELQVMMGSTIEIQKLVGPLVVK